MCRLILTGFLILASLARVLKSIARILRLTSKSIGAGFLLLTLSQLLSTYVVSLLIQMRSWSYIPPTQLSYSTDGPFDPYANSTVVDSDPYGDASVHTPQPTPTPVEEDASLLATLPDFRVFGRLFDVMFLLAALGTGLLRYLGEKLNGAEDLVVGSQFRG